MGDTEIRELTKEELEKITGGNGGMMGQNGEPLGIEATDNITMSYVINGKTYTTIFGVSDISLNDVFNKTVPCGTGVKKGADTAKVNFKSIPD